ncbi:MAG: hypothetical protein ACI93R_003642 [Flavobacteriales bacterium]|jgi:hypothetical protein
MSRPKGRVEYYAEYFSTKGERKLVRLFQAADLPIHYHIKIRAEANPYDPAYPCLLCGKEKEEAD